MLRRVYGRVGAHARKPRRYPTRCYTMLCLRTAQIGSESIEYTSEGSISCYSENRLGSKYATLSRKPTASAERARCARSLARSLRPTRPPGARSGGRTGCERPPQVLGTAGTEDRGKRRRSGRTSRNAATGGSRGSPGCPERRPSEARGAACPDRRKRRRRGRCCGCCCGCCAVAVAVLLR